MATALFITEQYIKDNTGIDGNVDAKYLRIAIEDAQLMRILPILGTALYDQIAAQVLAGSVTALNVTLLETYIQPALKHWVMVEMPDAMNYKYTNKAVVKKNADNAQPIEESEVIRQMDRHKDKAEYFSQRLTNYLYANTDNYPLFTNPGSAYDTVHPKTNNYTTTWYLGDETNTYGLEVDKGRENYC